MFINKYTEYKEKIISQKHSCFDICLKVKSKQESGFAKSDAISANYMATYSRILIEEIIF
jgi:hypothetical protein